MSPSEGSDTTRWDFFVIDESTYGPDHPVVAGDLINLALILRDLDDEAAARPLRERAMAISKLADTPNP